MGGPNDANSLSTRPQPRPSAQPMLGARRAADLGWRSVERLTGFSGTAVASRGGWGPRGSPPPLLCFARSPLLLIDTGISEITRSLCLLGACLLRALVVDA